MEIWPIKNSDNKIVMDNKISKVNIHVRNKTEQAS